MGSSPLHFTLHYKQIELQLKYSKIYYLMDLDFDEDCLDEEDMLALIVSSFF